MLLPVAAVAALIALAIPTLARAQLPDTVKPAVPLPPLRDTTLARPVVRDSTKPKPPRADSIQAPFGRGTPPPALDIGESYTYTRDQLFASGALSLTDLLARIPGVTTFQTGWISSPQVAAYYGDMTRLQIYYDGVQIDNLDPRNGSVQNLTTIPIWSLDHITLTRGANDIRVDLQSWQYDNTNPYTRVDVLTGDLSTDLYRAFYGKRFYNGAALQIGAQQFGATDNRNGGGGQTLELFGRYGIARKLWSVDVTAIRTNTERSVTYLRYPFPTDHPDPTGGSVGELLPDYSAANTFAYLRAAIGTPGSGPFVQFVASTQSFRDGSPKRDSAAVAGTAAPYNLPYGFPVDTVDTLQSESQYIATAGTDFGGLRLRLIDRYRTQSGNRFNSPMATADFTSRVLSWDALAEHDPYYGYTRFEGGARFSPLPFVALSGYVGERTADATRNAQPDSRSMRLEAGIRLFNGLWLSAGVLTRDTAVLVAPIVFDTAFRPFPIGRSSGHIFALKGPVGYGFSIDATETHWPTTTPYLPKDQFHGELQYFTEGLSKFPKHNFSFKVAAIVDYRGEVAFPELDAQGNYFFRYTGGILAIPTQVPIYSILAEIRILRGVITYQRRNATLVPYDQVPGFAMPRGINTYGVRWYFFE